MTICSKLVDLPAGDHEVRLSVRNHYHHYGAELAASRRLECDEVVDALTAPLDLSYASTAGGRFGLVPNSFNTQVRGRLHATQRWRSEVALIDDFGSTLAAFDPRDRTRTGYATEDRFDLAVIDEHAAARRVWNQLVRHSELDEARQERFLAFAEWHLREHWSHTDRDCLRTDVARAWTLDDPLENFERQGQLTRSALRRLAALSRRLPRLPDDSLAGLILGEVQLGNWGLAYRDVGRALAAREKLQDGDLQLFIVIALDGCLAKSISASTVTFEQVATVLERVGRQLTVPTWLIGVDYDHGTMAPDHPRSGRD